MSGTPTGIIDAYTAAAGRNEYQQASEVFKLIFDALEANPNTTRIALQYGSGGTGTDYWDGANPWGDNGFAVWRFEPSAARAWPYYVLVQSANAGGTSANFGAAPGDPGVMEGNQGTSYGHVGWQCAIGIGGDENPWNGTTADDGTDDKGGSAAYALGNDGNGTVWRTPAAGTNLMVFPRSNNGNGTYDAIKQDHLLLFNYNSQLNTRMHVISDDDSVFIDLQGTISGCGIYTPHPGITIDRPFLMYRNAGSVPTSPTERQGGIAYPDSTDSDPVRNVSFTYSTAWTAGSQPNGLFSPAQYDLTQAWVKIVDSINTKYVDAIMGVWGAVDGFVKLNYDIPADSTNIGKTIASLGTTTTAAWKYAMPWDGVSTPGANFTRTGIGF